MPFDLNAALRQAHGRHFELFERHVNPQLARVLRTIGLDRGYVRGEGAWLWDDQGNRYLDLIGGFGVFNVGRNHPDIRRALADFLDAGYPSLVQLDTPLLCGLLAEELIRRVPYGLERVYFTNSGTEGVEAAIKFARCATGRPAILHCTKAFHGLTNGSLALNGDAGFRAGFAPFLPDCRAVEFNNLESLETALRSGDVAALVVEPIQGKGVNIPAPGYLKAAADLCHKYGALFVADEVQTGIGRTGRFLAIDHEPGVEPDMVILSKGLSGGFVPVGAVLYRRWIYDKVFSSMERAMVHSSTFGKGGFGMVAGLATLACLDEHRLLDRAARLGERLGRGLLAMQPRFEFIKAIRWRGLMVGIEFGPPRSLGLKSAWKLVHTLDGSLFPQAVVMPLMEDHRILTQVAGHHIDVIKLLPPLVLDDADVDAFLNAFGQVMESLHRFPGPAWEALARIGRHALQSRAPAKTAAAP
ncbi:MAG: aspartate aminotransferase family protein [Pseudomonadota bacterium]|nr:aspartate aminotransferase family protein [Pseudomonadota bacterium]